MSAPLIITDEQPVYCPCCGTCCETLAEVNRLLRSLTLRAGPWLFCLLCSAPLTGPSQPLSYLCPDCWGVAQGQDETICPGEGS